MTFILACAAYMIFFAFVAVMAEKYTPLVAIGGLLLVMAALRSTVQ